MNALEAFLSFFFAQNLLLVCGLGLSAALRGGMAYRFRLAEYLGGGFFVFLAGLAAWALQYGLVELAGLSYLRTLSFVLVVIAVLYGSRALARALAGNNDSAWNHLVLPVNASCMILGLMLLVAQAGLGFGEALAALAGGVLGYGVALWLHAEVLRRMELEWVPKAFRGLPLALISMGLLALVFLGIGALLLPSFG